MNTDELSLIAPYACLACRKSLEAIDGALHCPGCGRTHPVVDGIPDFLAGDPRNDDIIRFARRVDRLAPIYESPFWYSLLLRLSGTRETSIESIARFHAAALEGVTGAVLDVACGSATYSRRITSPERIVCAFDISLGMLQRGRRNVKRDGVSGVRLARARVEQLPFVDASFNGVVCSGSLHLFPDTTGVLREIARVMKPGAPLSIQTFVKGETRINSLLKRRSAYTHTFELPELKRCLDEAGFEDFRLRSDGIVILFTVRKAASSRGAG